MNSKKALGSDFNLDGEITITDYSLWLDYLYDNVVIKLSDNLFLSIQNTDFGRFFEIAPDGIIDTLVFLWFWLMFFSVILVPVSLFVFFLIKIIKIFK